MVFTGESMHGFVTGREATSHSVDQHLAHQFSGVVSLLSVLVATVALFAIQPLVAQAADASYKLEPTTASTGTQLLNELNVGTKQFEFGGYFRAGTGWNQGGGRQRCFRNPGQAASANEFRLGNECGTYGEAALRTHLLKGGDKESPYFNAITTVAYTPNADTQYESAGGFQGNSSLNLIEAYVEGGNLDELGLSFWAGKRFYRTVDAHMDDFYYFANMSGNGAGVGNFKTSFGTFRAALLQETSTIASATGVITHIDTGSAGSLSKTAFDLRLDNAKITDVDTLFGWLVAAATPPGTDQTTGTKYLQAHGYAGGIRYNHSIKGNLFGPADDKRVGANDFAAVLGTGVMETLEMNGGSAVSEAASYKKDSRRIRVVDHATIPLTERLATHFAAIYEYRSQTPSMTTGARSNSYWWDIGVRPVYAFTEHYSLAFEAGHSEVRDDSEAVGVRQLTRFTLAPQVAMSNNIFGRPVIRAFVTQSLWNDANRTQLVLNSQEYQNSNSALSLGFQTEVWF